METGKRLDVVEILKLEKEYYLEQVKRINIALAALDDASETTTTTQYENKPRQIRKVKWMAEAEKVLESNRVVTIDLIQEKMVENGITEADSQAGRNSINTTLARLVKKGKLRKMDDGTYRRPRQRIETGVTDEDFSDI